MKKQETIGEIKDSTIRVQDNVKSRLCSLEFVKKGYTYNQIIKELIEHYKKTSN